MPANLENLAVATVLEKVSFHSNPKEHQCQIISNYWTTVLISHASKVTPKTLQARLQQYMNWEVPDVQAEFRKDRGTGDQMANICWIIENSRKTSASLTMLKPLTMWITTNCGKFLKRWEYQTTLPASWEMYMSQEATVRTGHETMDWFKIGQGVYQCCILLPCLFNLYAEYIM